MTRGFNDVIEIGRTTRASNYDLIFGPQTAGTLTGFFRDGCCNTGSQDRGSNTVCAVVTTEFLRFSQERGNDLSTPRPEYDFPGLKDGNNWCLCALRWQEAFESGCAPTVALEATHIGVLKHCALKDLQSHANSR